MTSKRPDSDRGYREALLDSRDEINRRIGDLTGQGDSADDERRGIEGMKQWIEEKLNELFLDGKR